MYGNLAPFLHSDTKSLFQETFRALTENSSDSPSNKTKFLQKLANFSETTKLIELFSLISEIQSRYSRGMVTYDFTNLNFKLVQPTKFPQTEIGCTEKCRVSFKRDVAKVPEKDSNPAQELESGSKISLMQENNFPPLTKQGGGKMKSLCESKKKGKKY